MPPRAEKRNYTGPERRHHFVVRTDGLEYHLRDSECLGVLDLRSGDWDKNHRARGDSWVARLTEDGQRIEGAARRPEPGDRLVFSNEWVTTPVEAIDRPPRAVVRRSYALLEPLIVNG